MSKYGTAGGALFQSLAITKAGATPPSLHFAKKDFNHVAFAPFATACFRSICTRYLEQTSSHLIGKLKSFVMARMSFGKHVNNPLKWTSTVESSWHELQGAIKRFDPEALGIQPASRGSFAG
jgi:hypothetical protein